MKRTGVARSIREIIWRSTAESAPKLETRAMRPGNRSSIARRSNFSASSAKNLSASREAAIWSPKRRPSGTLIKGFLEWCHADTPVGREEILVLTRTDLQVSVDDFLDRIDDLVGRKAGSRHIADRAVFIGGAAERDLVGFHALLFQAQNADMAHVVMAAGIDAAGNIDLELTDLACPVGVAKTLRDPLRDRNRARGCERAIVETGAGDNVRDKADVGRCKIERNEPIVDGRKIGERHRS